MTTASAAVVVTVGATGLAEEPWLVALASMGEVVSMP